MVTPLAPNRCTEPIAPVVVLSKNGGTVRMTSGLPQNRVATPTKMTRRPSETIRVRWTEAPCSRRISCDST